MEKISFGDWLINFKSLRNEYYEMSNEVERSKKDVQDLIKEHKVKIDILESEIENLNIRLAKKKKKISDLESELALKTSRNLALDKVVSERAKEIQELHYELSKINLKLDKKNRSFNKIRGSIGGVSKGIEQGERRIFSR